MQQTDAVTVDWARSVRVEVRAYDVADLASKRSFLLVVASRRFSR